MGVRNVDALITDTPYSARTHKGHNGGTANANRAEVGRVNRSTGQVEQGWKRASITYAAWSPADVSAFVAHWAPRTRGWFVAMTDHVLAPVWIASLEKSGRYVFSPLAYMATGSRVRLTGDGPAQWAAWIVVARPRSPEFVRWGALPGGYVLPRGEHHPKPVITGGKSLWIMRQLVRDYSRAGDLVCDPCAGAGTTLRAARAEGRRAIASESDPETYALALRELAKDETQED